MEILSFLGALIGLIAAIIGRKKIIVHTTSHAPHPAPESPRWGTTPITIGKRFKRACIALVLGFAIVMLGAAIESDGPRSMSDFWMIPFVVGFAVAAYQLFAAFLMILVRL